ncbi:hypothetical protein RclHR1_00590032 [Rhizophagus clarus]|uniref:Uncharacterized protein n=1 Tax=Rhizophagus clarus TaxID=94130 RepID=A0A2Z6RPP4_9GLOM|nr:hypothetical protein RclHR1_00590032 [Rhizophagus clarus]
MFSNNGNLDIQAYGHWSEDGTQDAWFTASCFNAVFTMMERKPKWIKVISDNGAHYHNSQLTTLIITHAIKRYVRVGCDLKEGSDIEAAIANLGGTSVARITPGHDEHAELVKAQYWRMDLLFFTEFLKPTSETSTPTIPSSPWTMPKPYGLAKTRNKEQLCLSTGNANKSDYYSEQDIYNELFNLADKREIDRNKIPKTQTIKGCIGRYSRQMKKEAAEKASENIGEGSEGNKKLKM